MLGRVVAGTMASIGLLCATVAWTGWVYLHTVGDPHRTEDIASAVLDSPAARAEVAEVLTAQIVERTGIPVDAAPTVSTAVEDVLADPRIARNLIDAFGSEHARALGVDDPRPTTVDTQAIVAAAQEHLALAAPQLAAAMQSALAGVVIEPLELPDLHTDAAGRIRDAADATTTSLAILAAAFLVAAFVVGDRRHIVRRFGTWAVFTGIGWLVGPYLVAAIAKQLSDFDATIDAIRRAVQGPVITGAIVLVAGGMLALVAWIMPIWRGSTPASTGGVPVRQHASGWGRRPTRGPIGQSGVPVAPAARARAAAPADTFVWSGQPPVDRLATVRQPTYRGPNDQQATAQHPIVQATAQQATAQQATAQQPAAQRRPTSDQPGAPSQPASGHATEAIWGTTRPTPPGAPPPAIQQQDQDPWSIYFGEAPREK